MSDEKLILETKPPDIHKEYTSNKHAQSILDAATKFHLSFGILPSVRCRDLTADLNAMAAELPERPTPGQLDSMRKKYAPLLSERYGLKENLVKQTDKTSVELAAKVLLAQIVPAYERSERQYADAIKNGLRKLGKASEHGSFMSNSVGTPFVRIALNVHDRFILMPTTNSLLAAYKRKYVRVVHPYGIAWLKFERAEHDELTVTSLQRNRFYEVILESHFDYCKICEELKNSNKQAFAPYGMLEPLFLLVVGLTKCRTIFIPTTKAVFDRWTNVFKELGKSLPVALSESDFRIYDELGKKYGKHVDALPKTSFLRRMEKPQKGWRIDLH